MNCSVAVFSFSLCPLQALSADACRARPKENVRTQGLGRGQLLMALRWTEASSSLWPPERKATPVGNKMNNNSIQYLCFNLSPDTTALCLTCDCWGDSAAQGGDSCHSDLLRAVLGGAAVSSGDHVGFEQSALQVNMVVWHGLVHCRQDLKHTDYCLLTYSCMKWWRVTYTYFFT